MVSSLDLFAFSSRISGVIKGLCVREEHVIVLSGACLSSVVESTELKRSRYDWSDVGRVEWREDDKMSLEKLWISMERNLRTDFLMCCVLG
jgi:hypothetical protein